MESQIIDEVTEWESRGYSGGYAGLHGLADEDFTGAVTEGMGWLFMLNGRVVGVFDGSIEDFADADGTAYEAPHPSLPLLLAMKGTGGETRAKYYTEDTPLSQVDGTLSSGGFTGYVELSENVLSGDYYVVYHGGRSLACAFVGNSRQLLTGEEAFERADDEVGIYEVVDVDVEVVEIPDAPSAGTTDETGGTEGLGAAGTAGATGSVDANGQDATAVEPGAGESTAAADADSGDADADATADSATGSTADSATESTATGGAVGSDADGGGIGDRIGEAEPGSAETADATGLGDDAGAPTAGAGADPTADDAVDPTADDATDPTADDATADADEADGPVDAVAEEDPAATGAAGAEADEDAADATASDVESAVGSGVGGAVDTDSDADEPSGTVAGDDAVGGAATTGSADADAGAETDDAGAASGSEDVFSEEERWREARAIPSLDPSKSQTDSGRADDDRNAARQPRTNGTRGAAGEGAPSDGPTGSRAGDEQDRQSARASDERVAELRDRLQEVQQARTEAENARDQLATEREQLASEREQLEGENERLRARVEELEAEVERLEERLAEARERAGGAVDHTMSPQQALDGTNLFVRYESKSGATLEKAHAGEAGRDEVAANLRVEHHTGFETEGLHVGGRPFREFLDHTIEYGFVQWVVGDLLYEIRDTANTGELGELFDAIPKIDRAELHGSVSVRFTENGEEHREQETFDVVLRDRMGNPLIVANLNDSREPAAEDAMTSLVQTARRVKETSDSLGAALYVTSSYFEPSALETAADATGGGLLSRGRRKSFVKLSRKQGFHLCLVETREGNFHVNVPEL